jgi:3,2-trans-enoyl-CoA isomerase
MSARLVLVERAELAVGSRKMQYGILKMNRPPANALNLELVSQLQAGLEEFERDENVYAVVLQSAVPSIFSAGIELSVFQKPFEEYMVLWAALRKLFLSIYMTRLVSFAAISGHSPAGGAILSLACHYRYMLRGPFQIGLNEVAVGIQVPIWLTQVFAQTVGHRNAERLLSLGTTVDADEAERIGFIDKAANDVQELSALVAQQMAKCLSVPPQAREVTLQFLRRDFAKRMTAEEPLDTDGIRRVLASAEFKRVFSATMKRLAEKKGAPKSKL